MAMMTTVRQLLEKAAQLETQAAALRTAAAVLQGDVQAGKQKRVARTLASAIGLRAAQRNGHAGREALSEAASEATGEVASETVREPGRRRGRPRQLVPGSKWVRPGSAKHRARVAKRAEVLAIVRDYGKPMPLAKLLQATRAKGITSLTGISAYVKAGYLQQTGTKGDTRYKFVQLPPPA